MYKAISMYCAFDLWLKIKRNDQNFTGESFMTLVTSGWILFAIPKSINFSEAFTMTKFAGFKSRWTIPAQRRYFWIKRKSESFPTQHFKVYDLSWDYGFPTIFVDGLDGLQHVLPVQLPLQWIHSAAFLQPPVQIQVAALHQHVYIAAGYFTAKIFLTVTTCLLKWTILCCHIFWSRDGNMAVLTSRTAWWFDRCAAASGLDV